MTLAEHSGMFCYLHVLQEAGVTPPGPWAHRPTYMQALLMALVPLQPSQCPLLHRPSASPGGWGVWSSGPERCLQGQVLRDTGAWWGQEMHFCSWYPGLGYFWGYGRSPKATEVTAKPAKMLADLRPSSLPSFCSLNLLQSVSNVTSDFSKILLAWAKLQLL